MTKHKQVNPPTLEERFTEPQGWRWHSFKSDGRLIRFGSVFPKDSIPQAVVVCLPGLSEFVEKYFEVARTVLSKNLAFWVIDWYGQGRSGRYLPNRHKRHSHGFQKDIDDFHALILGYVKHSSVHPDVGRIPLVMLAHSMGANIGLHYLQQHQGLFECAAFSAPMFGIKAIKAFPFESARMVTGLLNLYLDTQYVPGGRDWHEDMRTGLKNELFSSDPVRREIHNAWPMVDSELQIGNATYRWLHEAILSCVRLQNPAFLQEIKTPCLIATAGHERLVDNKITQRIARLLPHAELLHLEDARHEIMMECDAVRDVFFDHFYKLVKETVLDRPETLKPF